MLHMFAAVDPPGTTAPSTNTPSTNSIINADAIGIPKVDANDKTIKTVLSYIFVLAGAISLLMIMIGGVRYMISTGDPQKTITAKNTILYAVIGLVISISAFAIVNFIFKWA